MRAFKVILLPILLAFFMISNSNAQDKDFKRWAIELDGGATYPNVDIDGLISVPMGRGGIRYNLTDIFGLKGDFSIGTLEGGEDRYNREFTNEYMRYGLKAQLNVGKMANFQKSLKGVGLQLTTGINRIHSDVTEGQNLTYEGFANGDSYSNEDLAASFGGLLQFKLGSAVSLNLGADYYMSTTDLIDGYSAAVRANTYDDRYVTATLGLSINLGSGEEHADWVDMSQSSDLEEKTSSNQKSLKELHNKLDDADNDGVINAIDQDNATKEGVRVTAKGVPMDTDYDGMPDYMDKCPVDSGLQANDGCPEGWDSLRKARAEQVKRQKARAESAKSGSDDGSRSGSKGASGRSEKSGDQGSMGNKGSKGSQGNKSSSGSSDASGPTKGKRTYSEEEVREYTKIPAESKTNPSQASNFYIIGGSFNSKANAIDYQKYLESEGFNSEILFVKSINMFRVAFKEYSDHQSAKNALGDIRTNFGEGSWILMY